MNALAHVAVLPCLPPTPGDHYVCCDLDSGDAPVVILTTATWERLGHPRAVTVTIHPGDTLTD